MKNDDQKFFEQVMAEVEPLVKSKQQNKQTKTHATLATPVAVTPLSESSPEYTFYDNEFFPVSAAEVITFSRDGFSNQKELRAKKWPIQASLDLHGYTVDEAREEIARFLEKSVRQQYRCIKIIHGKGRGEQPILKNKVAQWLPQCPEVLAFCSASLQDGGSGAVYVLLRKALGTKPR